MQNDRLLLCAGPAGTVLALAGYIPKKAGCTFDGWYSDDSLNNRITSVTVDKNTTVYAKWTANKGLSLLQTGDGSNGILFVVLLLLSGVVIAVILKKDRQSN